MPIFRITISILFTLLPLVRLEAQAVVINEFQASNHETIADEDGDFPDWIELYNHGETPVFLNGYGLSDDETNPFRWVLPDVVLEPGQFLLIFASNKDRLDGPHLHTNFAISSSGEELLLTTPEGVLIDFVDPTPVPVDVSFGRQPDGTGDWYFFDVPTPGSPNAGAPLDQVLDPPSFSHEGGFYTDDFLLSIDTVEPGATILYTLDGSEPRPEHMGGTTYWYKSGYQQFPVGSFGSLTPAEYRTFEYSAPITIEDRTGEPARLSQRGTTWHRDPALVYLPEEPVFQGTVVRARTVRDGAISSPVVTHTFFVTPEGADRYSLPVIALSIQEDSLFDYEQGIYTPGIDFDQWRQAHPFRTAGLDSNANYYRRGINAEFPGHMEFILPNRGRVWSQNLGIRIHGNTARSFAQKSIRLYARNAYDDSNVMEYPFIAGLRERRSGSPMTSYRRLILRNSGSDYIGSRIRDAFQQVLISPLGLDYQGYAPAVHFINGEYWGTINIRERVDQHFLAAHHGVDADSIELLKEASDELIESEGHEDLIALRVYAEANDLSQSIHFEYMAEQMDMANYILYNMIQIYAKNTDWPANNWAVWRTPAHGESDSTEYPDDGRWRWIIFDMDFGFGTMDGLDVSHDTLSFATATDGPEWPNPPWATAMLRNLLANEGFRTEFINAFADHMNTTYRPVSVVRLIDELQARIAPYLPEHVARWQNMESTSPDFMRAFALSRPAFMRHHIANYFELEGMYELRIALPDEGSGRVRVNSIELEANGGEWTGLYFLGVPIEVEVLPRSGHEFLGWQGAFEGEGSLLQLTPGGDIDLTPTVLKDGVTLHEVVLPRFMQGESPNNNDRVPYTCRLRIEGLLPNAEYRFANRIVTPDDSPTQNGAGNAIYFDPQTGSHYRTTATPDFAEPDTHGVFTTNEDGAHEGWFTLEPSGNARFAEPELFVRILLNDGMGGSEYTHFLTTENAVRILPFGTGWDEATGLHASSPMSPGSVVVLHDTLNGQGRPLTATLVEDAGFEVDERYANFYAEVVSGQDGHFGTLLPNFLPTGLLRIENFDWQSAASNAVYTQPGAIWPDDVDTVNPAGGLDFPIVLSLGSPATGIPGDVNNDGVVNAVDVQLVINAALGIAIDPAYEPDINGDGVVNAVDVQLVTNAALGVP